MEQTQPTATTHTSPAAAECSAAQLLSELPKRILKKCHDKQWSTEWDHRGVYLHLEVSELIEAIRGKRGDPTEESADVLFTVIALMEANGIDLVSVLKICAERCEDAADLR